MSLVTKLIAAVRSNVELMENPTSPHAKPLLTGVKVTNSVAFVNNSIEMVLGNYTFIMICCTFLHSPLLCTVVQKDILYTTC